jgi:hypothetical protein
MSDANVAIPSASPPAGNPPAPAQSHRVPPDDNKIPNYENMSFEQRRFAQDQKRAQRGR